MLSCRRPCRLSVTVKRYAPNEMKRFKVFFINLLLFYYYYYQKATKQNKTKTEEKKKEKKVRRCIKNYQQFITG